MAKLTPEDAAKLRQQLTVHEGRRRYPYRCTAGKLSIAVGYNIDDRGLGALHAAIGRTPMLTDLYKWGLTEAEIDAVLDADIRYYESRVIDYFPLYLDLDSVRQRAVVDFAFNLGKRALGFRKAIDALTRATTAPLDHKQQFYDVCALEMMRSLWASQVGDGAGGKRYDRAERLADMIRTGQEPRF